MVYLLRFKLVKRTQHTKYSIMKKLIVFPLLFCFAVIGLAQTTQETNDPKAKAILDKIKAKYDSYKSMEAQFTLTIEIPEADTEVQKGSVKQSIDKYRLELQDQTIISDGATLWYHIKSNNEVQVNTVDPDAESDMLSPRDLMRIYEAEDYKYVLTNETYEKGKPVQQIEFKPTDRDSEYSKLRLTVDKKANEIVRIKTFGKDGSRFTFELDELTPNIAFAGNTFKFDASKYPDIHIEDLRID